MMMMYAIVLQIYYRTNTALVADRSRAEIT